MKTLHLETLDLTPVRMGWDIPPHINRTVKGTPLSIAGQRYERGIWMNAPCSIPLRLDGQARRLRCGFGHEDLVQSANYEAPRLRFQVELDGEIQFDSDWMASGDPARYLDLDLSEASSLILRIVPENAQVGNAQGNWIHPELDYAGAVPFLELAAPEEAPALPPPDGYSSFLPGQRWFDTDGVPIQAHGAGLLEVDGTYYMYGEHKGGTTSFWPKSRVDIIGVGVYSSQDLMNWKNEGIVLPATPQDPESPLHPSNVLERPKVQYNARTGNYVMWVKSQDAHYSWGHAMVAQSDSPTGPFEIVSSERPWKDRSFGDFALYQENGTGYLIIATGKVETTFVYRLSPDFLRIEEELSAAYPGEKREAPALLKQENLYYLITSGKSGWAPNPTRYATATSLEGPWTDQGLLFVGDEDENSFRSQPTFVLQAGEELIYMGDRWDQRDLGDSRYIWLPITLKEQTLSASWQDSWTLRQHSDLSDPSESSDPNSPAS